MITINAKQTPIFFFLSRVEVWTFLISFSSPLLKKNLKKKKKKKKNNNNNNNKNKNKQTNLTSIDDPTYI